MSGFSELVPLGKTFTSQGRTIGEGDFTLLTNLTWTLGELHTNREYMKGTQFGERILAGPCVLSVVIGLSGTGPFGEVLHQEKLHVVALLGFDEVRFRAPVRPGDTITAYTQVVEVRPSSKNPRRGVLRIKDWATNQNGELVVEAYRASLVELTG